MCIQAVLSGHVGFKKNTHTHIKLGRENSGYWDRGGVGGEGMGDGLEQDTLYVYEILITLKISPHLKKTTFLCLKKLQVG